MADLTDDDVARIIEGLRPVLIALVQETLRAAGRPSGGVSITTATLRELEGPDAVIAPDDNPEGEVQVTRADAALVPGARVFVVHYPPNGAFILPAIPEPTS